MYEKLMKVGMKEARCQYILMDLIKPISYDNYLIVEGNGSRKNVISELGIFGVCLTLVFLHFIYLEKFLVFSTIYQATGLK